MLAECVSSSPDQTFDFHLSGQGLVRSAAHPGLCLTVDLGADAGEAGQRVVLANCTGADGQRFVSSRQEGDGSAFVGVNLGGWLLCEDWMWRDGMENQGLTDEWSLVQRYGGPTDPRAIKVLQDHWDSFLRPEHLDVLKRFGITHVRIPFGWWMLDEVYDVQDGFIGGQEPFLARALGWLRVRNMQAVLDLHAMPGAQARWDGFTGKRADPKFFTNTTHFERGQRAVDALVQLVLRYEANPSTSGVVMGIQLLNEPSHSFWDTSPGIREFYEGMVPRVRKYLPAHRYMVMLSFMDSPQTQTSTWLAAMRQRDPQNFAGVVYDKHLYHSFGDNVAPWTTEMDACKTCCRDSHILEPMWDRDLPIIIGEYSLSTGFEGWNKGTFLKSNFENQLSLFSTTRGLVGSFAWNFRIYVEAHTDMYMEWSLVDLIESGHLEKDAGFTFKTSELCPVLGGDFLRESCPTFGNATLWDEVCHFKVSVADAPNASSGGDAAMDVDPPRRVPAGTRGHAHPGPPAGGDLGPRHPPPNTDGFLRKPPRAPPPAAPAQGASGQEGPAPPGSRRVEEVAVPVSSASRRHVPGAGAAALLVLLALALPGRPPAGAGEARAAALVYAQ